MKKLATSLLLVVCIKISIAQQDTLYFDKTWKESSKDSSVYYRVFGLENGRDMVRDYHQNGNLQMKARISQRVPLIVDGTCLYYSENGKRESKGIYELNKKIGVWVYYDQVGSDSSVVEHFLNELKKEIKVTQEYSSLKNFISVEVMPEFPGKEEGLFKYMKDSIKYPSSAKKDKIQGTVYVRFIINEQGEVKDAKVVRGVREDIDEEARKVIQSMPKWTPGYKNGKAINVMFIHPIKFKL